MCLVSDLIPCELRPADPDDRGYVVDSWLKSYRSTKGHPTQTPHMDLPDYAYWSRFGHVGLVEALLRASDVMVACKPDTPFFIFGWTAYTSAARADGDAPVLHYIHVREEYQRQGFGLRLLAHAVGDAAAYEVTHETKAFRHWLDPVGRSRFVNPYRYKGMR